MATATLGAKPAAEGSTINENGRRYEWVDGQLVEKPMGAEAGRITARLLSRMELHAEAHGLGLTFTSEAGYQIFGADGNRLRYADGSFIAKGRLPQDQPPKGHVRIAPDLVLEVVSPNDLAVEVEIKIEEYFQVGVRLLWVVYPETQKVYVYRPNGQITRLSTADELMGEDVLSGFVCPVRDLFKGLQPAAG